MKFTRWFNRKATPQMTALAGQVQNDAGGYGYALDPWKQLDRFLVLGTCGGTYYVSEQKLTRDNAGVLEALVRADPRRFVDKTVEISEQGRAPKNDAAIFALALAAAGETVEGRRYALAALPRVCRTATHLFQFQEEAKELRGRGPALKKAVARWYNEKAPRDVAYQVVKYREREGWTHADVFNLARPNPEKARAEMVTDRAERKMLYRWIVDATAAPPIPVVEGFRMAQRATAPTEWARLVRDFGLAREMLPTGALAHAEVWAALLEKMPMTAMLRNLGNMTKTGLLAPMSEAARTVAVRLEDGDALQAARVHPLAVLFAMKTYAQGKGFRGHGEWEPVAEVVDALDAAFYAAFGNVVPSNQRILLALDVSGSMTSPLGGSALSCREAAAAMALVSMKTEPRAMIGGFTAGRGGYRLDADVRDVSGFSPLKIGNRQRLDDVVRYTEHLAFGATDCSLPMRWAMTKGLEFDAFVVYTDNETWAGPQHPSEALREYRRKTGIDSKLVVVAMTSTGFTIADPKDPGMLDVAGFDTATPDVIGAFVRGEI
ncbi:MAG: TROVE domain-containing protein [Planctomycetota bacterium]